MPYPVRERLRREKSGLIGPAEGLQRHEVIVIGDIAEIEAEEIRRLREIDEERGTASITRERA